MISFDKDMVRQALSIDDIFNLLTSWGGEPEYTPQGIICQTICHNEPGVGSRKLYYYENDGFGLFRCYTGCDSSFDIFELCIKVYSIQKHQDIDLNDAIRLIASWCGISGEYKLEENNTLPDWDYFDSHKEKSQFIFSQKNLQFYNQDILNRFNYSVKITPWLNEDISQRILDKNLISYYPGGDQIVIPHFDTNNNLIGIRGRTLCAEDAERFGKYRPLLVNQQLYNHPLGLNLYGLNIAKENIAVLGKAIVFEAEKSVLKYQSYFGLDNSIAVACCGSSLSDKQIELLLNYNVKEIIIAFDRQFQSIGDKEFVHLKTNLLKLWSKYKNLIQISFIFDKNMLTNYKASPIDEGKEKFLQLYKERIIL